MPSATKKQQEPDLVSKILDTPWHFIAFSLFFSLRGGLLNPHLFSFAQVLLYAIFITVIVYGIFWLVKHILMTHYAALFASILVILFFSYGNIYEVVALYVLSGTMQIPVVVLNNLPLFYLGLLLLLLVILAIQKREFKQLTTFVNVVAFTMLVSVIYNGITVLSMTIDTQINVAENPAIENIDLPATPPESTPDVYYLVLDGYPSSSYLLNHFGIDNSEFTQQLEDLGFFIAEDSLSNYTYTIASISSSLNMDYVQNLASNDVYASEIATFVLDNRTAKTFQDMGYEYIVVLSGYLANSEFADLTIDVDKTGQLVYLDNSTESVIPQRDYIQYLYRTSFLWALDPSLAQVAGDINSWLGGERVAPQYKALKEIADIDAPTFTFFHVTKPHTPVVLDEDGNQFRWTGYYSNLAEYLEHEEEHFIGQLTYINKLTIDAIQEIIANSDEPPIIIIQGDHGLQLGRVIAKLGQNANWPISILNAYYFPDQDYSQLRKDITPINSFRVVFNQYFGIPYETLPETSYYQPQLTANVPDLRRLEFVEIAEGNIEPPWTAAQESSDE